MPRWAKGFELRDAPGPFERNAFSWPHVDVCKEPGKAGGIPEFKITRAMPGSTGYLETWDCTFALKSLPSLYLTCCFWRRGDRILRHLPVGA